MSEMDPSQKLRYWAHELAAIARTGLTYAVNDYDRDRYERAMAIAEGIAANTIDESFTPDRPYLGDVDFATPKVGCCVAAFDAEGRVLVIKRADNGRWALPGGWAEVGSPPSTNALRELREEAGVEAEIEGLVGVYDNKSFGSVSKFQMYACCFRARVTGGAPTPSGETPEVRFFDPSALPEPMTDVQRAMIRDAADDRRAVFQ